MQESDKEKNRLMLIAILVILAFELVVDLAIMFMLATIVDNTNPEKKKIEQQKKEFEALGDAIIDYFKD